MFTDLLFSKTDVTITKRLPPQASFQSTLALLHDHDKFFSLAPHITSVKVDSSVEASDSQSDNWEWLILTEKIPGPLGTITFRCKQRCVEDGMDNQVFAGLGTRLWAKIRVKEDEEGVVITEEVQIQAFRFFMPFVKSTMTNAHQDMFEVLAKKVAPDGSLVQ